MSGYSGTPLIKKLGIKPYFRFAFVHEPANYRSLLGQLPEETLAIEAGDLDFIHAFFTERAEFEAEYRGVLSLCAADSAESRPSQKWNALDKLA